MLSDIRYTFLPNMNYAIIVICVNFETIICSLHFKNGKNGVTVQFLTLGRCRITPS